MKPIYEPKGKAKEYGDYAINIYTGCPHRCYYCFAPNVLRKDREQFHSCVEPRPNIVEEVKKQLDKEQITDKLIHLCFTCDPYPTGHDTTPTREIIKAIKAAGNRVQILTKGDGSRDLDLLDGGDWYGVTISGYAIAGTESAALYPLERVEAIYRANKQGTKTWISCEPVINARDILHLINSSNIVACVDKWKFGKLNYHPSSINWKEFGIEVEQICKERFLDYYIKDSLREEMNK